MNENYYVNVKKLMGLMLLPPAKLKRPTPKTQIISITVPLWSDLNVRY